MPSEEERLREEMNEYAKMIQKNAERLEGNFDDVNILTLSLAEILEGNAKTLRMAIEYFRYLEED